MRKNIILALLTGIILALAFPPFKTGFLAYGALIPFFLLLEDKSPKEAFRWGYITGLIIAITTFFWIGWVTLPGLIGVLLVWPLFIAFYSLLHVLFLRTLSVYAYAMTPFLWTAVEYLQSLSELAFPWNYLGYTQSFYVPLIQYAEYTGVFGISFWVVLLNVLLFMLWKNRRSAPVIAGALIPIFLLFVLPLLYGRSVLAQKNEGKSLLISLVQGNRDPNEKWTDDIRESNYRVYEQMTRDALQKKPDLVIWPETAMPFYLRSERDYLKRVHALMDSTGATLLTGALDYEFLQDGSYEYFNSALMIEPYFYTMQSYNKMKLVPFSERVPYKHFFPFNVLRKVLVNLGIGDYALGKEIGTFQGNTREANLKSKPGGMATQPSDYNTAVAICYESVFPDHVRQYVAQGADFLLIITNDAWFGKTSAPFQHRQMAVFRAIENRRDIARCANTGISCFIDKFGQVRNSTKLYTPDVVTDSVTLCQTQTFYAQHGNVFAVFAGVISGLTLFFAVLKKLFVHG